MAINSLLGTKLILAEGCTVLGWQARLRAAFACDKYLRPVEGAGGKFYQPAGTVFLFAG